VTGTERRIPNHLDQEQQETSVRHGLHGMNFEYILERGFRYGADGRSTMNKVLNRLDRRLASRAMEVAGAR
jgi:hypothetical protein